MSEHVNISQSANTSMEFQWTPGVVKRFVQIATLMFAQASLLFGSAGRLNWPVGWIYLGLYLCNIGVNLLLLMSKGTTGTALVEERARIVPERKWDRMMSGAWAGSYLTMLGVAGFDHRFGWSPDLGWAVQLSALLAMGWDWGWPVGPC